MNYNSDQWVQNFLNTLENEQNNESIKNITTQQIKQLSQKVVKDNQQTNFKVDQQYPAYIQLAEPLFDKDIKKNELLNYEKEWNKQMHLMQRNFEQLNIDGISMQDIQEIQDNFEMTTKMQEIGQYQPATLTQPTPRSIFQDKNMNFNFNDKEENENQDKLDAKTLVLNISRPKIEFQSEYPRKFIESQMIKHHDTQSNNVNAPILYRLHQNIKLLGGIEDTIGIMEPSLRQSEIKPSFYQRAFDQDLAKQKSQVQVKKTDNFDPFVKDPKYKHQKMILIEQLQTQSEFQQLTESNKKQAPQNIFEPQEPQKQKQQVDKIEIAKGFENVISQQLQNSRNLRLQKQDVYLNLIK